MELSGILDTDRLILVKLPVDSLYNACRSSTYLNSICHQPHFWRMRLESRFGISPPNPLQSEQYYFELLSYTDLPINNENYWNDKVIYILGSDVAQHKPDNETYQQQYNYITNTSLGQMTADGRIDGLIFYKNKGIYPSTEDSITATHNNRLNVIQWLYQQGNLPTNIITGRIVGYNYLPMLRFLTVILDDYKFIMYHAIKNNSPEVLEWLYTEHDMLPDTDDIEVGYQFKKYDALMYIYSIMSPNIEDVNMAGKYLNTPFFLEMVKMAGVWPDQSTINEINNIGTLELIKNHTRLVPLKPGINNAVINGNIELTKWIYNNSGFYPSVYAINKAAENDDIDMIRFIWEEFRMLPSERVIDKLSYDRDYNDVGEWLRDNPI